MIVLAVGLLLVLVAAGVATVGAAMIARHRAQGAADFGALAGAAHAVEGETAACGQANEIVTANGARMTSCRLVGLDTIVTAEVTLAGTAGRLGVASATARAGPV